MYAKLIVAAFYDQLIPEQHDGWSERDKIIPLPGRDEGYAKIQLVGTTGAGKTTIVRQILGTDPKKERFPSTSASRTTTCDLEIILAEGDFCGVVSFLPREQVRQYVIDCVTAAVSGHLEDRSPEEVSRRLMEHNEQRFRLNYILGSVNPPRLAAHDDLFDEEAEDDLDEDDSEVTDEERNQYADRIGIFLSEVERLALRQQPKVASIAHDLGISLDNATNQDRDVIQELVEEELLRDEDFHVLVDEILDEVELRFDHIPSGDLVRSREGWPTTWSVRLPVDKRQAFLRAVNRFSSNYAPDYGKLLTPLVEGIRVVGPFRPEWFDGEMPRLVLLDGQGIGHVADSTSSISTRITSRFQTADVILLVDNAAQPMQAAPIAVLKTLSASGHESKLVLCFTHYDEVKGDNLPDFAAKRTHVIGAFYNAVHAIGRASGRDTERSLSRLDPDRIFCLAKIQSQLSEGAHSTRREFKKLLGFFSSSIEPQKPFEYHPVYDLTDLVLAIQKATQEFHDRWKGVLGMSVVAWQTIKALTRRISVFHRDEYGNLRPVADLIHLLQNQISLFLSEPGDWSPRSPSENDSDAKDEAISRVKQEVSRRLHSLSHRRIIDERLSGWAKAYEPRGIGSTKVRAREIIALYELAAPVPNEMPGPDTREFIHKMRDLVAESIEAGDGKLRGWKPDPDAAKLGPLK